MIVWVISLFTLLFLFVLVALFIKHRIESKKTNDVQSSLMPRVIWSYWESPELPDTIQKCLHSWKKHNPDTTIHMLNKTTYKNFVDKDITSYKMNDSPARFSDFLRLELLAKYGGIWIDSSTILNESLDWVFEMQKTKGAEFVGYFIPNFTTNDNFPVIESWFLAAPKESKFIDLWRKELNSINKYEKVDQYVENVVDEKVDLQNIPQELRGYLAIHVAIQKVMQKQYPQFHIVVKNASEEGGPFYYLNANDWKTDVALQKLCYDAQYRTPVVKLRGDERNYIENKASESMKQCLFR